jgi:hypothetical protein
MIEHHHHPRQASLEPSTNQYGILLNKSIPARALARAAPGLRLKAIPSVGCRIRLQTSCWVLQLRVQAEPAAGFRVPVVGPTTTQAFWQFMACVSQVPEQDVDACGEIKGVGVSGTGWTSPGVTICPGQKDAFTPHQVKRIRNVLASRGDQGLRDLALFSVAIDTMLQGPELLNLTVTDVRRSDGNIRSVIEVARRGEKPPVRSALSKVSANALRKWINEAGKKRTDYIFSGRGNSRSSHPMTVRQMSRLLREWVSDAGLDPEKYGIESLRRTKALHILNGTGDLETVRALLGHAKIESTARYLRIAKRSDPIAISRAFNI